MMNTRLFRLLNPSSHLNSEFIFGSRSTKRQFRVRDVSWGEVLHIHTKVYPDSDMKWTRANFQKTGLIVDL